MYVKKIHDKHVYFTQHMYCNSFVNVWGVAISLFIVTYTELDRQTDKSTANN